MKFAFTPDQLELREQLGQFLRERVTSEVARDSWEDAQSRADLWKELAELGALGVLAPEEAGGLGRKETDFVLIAEEAGRVALPVPLVDTALVAVPLMQESGSADLQGRIAAVVAGDLRVAVGHSANSFIHDSLGAALLLLQDGDSLHAVPRGQVDASDHTSVDPGTRLLDVKWRPQAATAAAHGEAVQRAWRKAFNRGALGAAAQALGVAQRIIELTAEYVSQRKQFGKPIGSFQAVKHHLADVAVKLEYARAPVYRAAYSLANDDERGDVHVSHAKIAACEAAALAARKAIQVHGAMGYTWECDLQIWMKRAWSLRLQWGDAALHRRRMIDALSPAPRTASGPTLRAGAGETF